MTLILTIENETSLPNGAPVSVRITDKRNLDIGRGAHLDWPLPDPSRFISGKHCEVRYRDEAYWLYDVSTNGTFLNDNTRRIQTPHKLCDGDRLAIGSYIIAVKIEEDQPKLDTEAEAEAEAAEAEITGSAAADMESAVGDAEAADIHAESAVVPSEPAAFEAQAAPFAGYAAEADFPPVVPHDEPVASHAEPEPELLEEDAHAAAHAAPASPDTEEVDVAAFEAPPAEPLPEPAEEAPFHQPAHEPIKDRTEDSRPAPAAFEAKPAAISMPRVSETPLYFNEPIAVHEPVAVEEPVALHEPAPAPDIASPRLPKAEPPAAAEVTQSKSDATLEDFLQHFAAAAGIPVQIFDRQDKLKTADDLGFFIHFVVSSLKQLLSARDSAKRFARTANRTVVQAFDNNPLKFAPTPEDALKIMFGPKTSGYLDARRTLEGAFGDLKTHQVKTFSAMQNAVKMLVEDLDPEEIDAAMGPDQGLLALLSSRKARLWDLYLARWQAKTLRHEDGLVDAFMLYFAECYDRTNDKG